MFSIFGWGKKTRKWPLSDGKELLAEWSYFSFNFLPGLAWSIKWYVVGDSRSEDKEITYDEVKSLFPENTPNLTYLERYGLIWIVLVTAILVIYAFVNRTW